MENYLNLLNTIKTTGWDHKDRTGVGRRSIFGAQLRFDLSDKKLPLVTTREIGKKGPFAEMLMFINGITNVKFLHQYNVHIWDSWAIQENTFPKLLKNYVDKGIATEEQAKHVYQQHLHALETGELPEDAGVGEIGPMYGFLWRNYPVYSEEIHAASVVRETKDMPAPFIDNLQKLWDAMPEEEKDGSSFEIFAKTHYYSTVDQLSELVYHLKHDPWSSRLLVTAFHPGLTPVSGYSPDENVLLRRGALMPCHHYFQCQVIPPKEEGGKLRLGLHVGLRSWDTTKGGPYNIAGYAFLCHLLAHTADMDAHELVISATDAHIYLNDLEILETQLARTPREAPTIWLNPAQKDIFNFTMDDYRIDGYDPHPAISYAPAAV